MYGRVKSGRSCCCFKGLLNGYKISTMQNTSTWKQKGYRDSHPSSVVAILFYGYMQNNYSGVLDCVKDSDYSWVCYQCWHIHSWLKGFHKASSQRHAVNPSLYTVWKILQKFWAVWKKGLVLPWYFNRCCHSGESLRISRVFYFKAMCGWCNCCPGRGIIFNAMDMKCLCFQYCSFFFGQHIPRSFQYL